MRSLVVLFLLTIGCRNGNHPDLETGLTPIAVQHVDQFVSHLPTDDGKDLTTITFDKMIYNFGEVPEGQIVEYTFNFVNTGSHPLVIQDVQSTCGCTIPEWPRQPIEAGERHSIDVKFDTTDKTDHQVKKVTIIANTLPVESEVALVGKVIPKLSEPNKKQ